MKEHTNNSIFGFWVYLMSDCVLFAGLFATFAVLRDPALSSLFSIPFVFIETIILLTSSLTVGLALLAANEGKKERALAFLTTTFILGLSFLFLESTEFRSLILEGHGPMHSAALSSFFTLVGIHGLHVAIGSLFMFILSIFIEFKGLTPGNMRKLNCLALFWHFLDVVWIFIFTFVYLLGFV